jgi:hypothetical protein
MTGTFKSRFVSYGPLILLILITLLWAIFFHYVSPDTVVKHIGVQNTYGVAFLMAAICGFSSITGSTFYITIAALSHGGANFLLLGLAGGAGLCISDTAFYYIVNKGTPVIDKHWQKVSNFIKKWMNIVPRWALYAFVFIYSGFFPIPNDVMLATLAIGGVKFKNIAPFLFAGDIVSTLLIAFLAR